MRQLGETRTAEPPRPFAVEQFAGWRFLLRDYVDSNRVAERQFARIAEQADQTGYPPLFCPIDGNRYGPLGKKAPLGSLRS